MKRRNFLRDSGMCAATLAFVKSTEVIAQDDPPEVKLLKAQKNYFINRHVVMFDILSEKLDRETFKQVYQEFGTECAINYGAVDRAEEYKGNLEKYLNEISSIDKWQEKAWYDEDTKTVTIIGVKRDECVCSMARSSANPNWCNFCCAGHQKAIFEKILGKEVEVTMGETRLSGGERCNHFIRILENNIPVAEETI
jgi:hypothetical protein